jgi:hypothetical protein
MLGLHISDDCRADVCNDRAILGEKIAFSYNTALGYIPTVQCGLSVAWS